MSEQEAWTMVNKISGLIEERDSLRERVAFLVAEAHGWQPRLEAAEAEEVRLQEALERISKLPLDEDESVAYAADKARREMQAIARAALDVPTKGISQGHMMDAKGEMGGYQG